jgi:hypothetical protein
MKRLLVVLLMIAVAFSLYAGGEQEAAGGGGEMEEGMEGEVQTLRIASPPWIFKKFNLEEFTTQWADQHPNIEVELTRADKWSAPTWITEFEQGSTPFDVFIGGSGSMLAPLITGGWTEPMDDMLEGEMSADSFVGGFLAAGHYKVPDGDGTNYPVLPFMGEVSIIGVNTEIMQNAGLWENGEPVDIPSWDEDEFFEWFTTLNEASDLEAHVQIWDREFMQYDYAGPIQAMTGSFTSDEGPGFDVYSDAAAKWLSFIQRMNEEGVAAYTTSDDEGYSKWKTGATGSFYAAQGHIMELVNVTEDTSDIAYIGWPGAEENGSIIWTHSAWIPKVSDRTELAKQYIREVIFSQDFQQWSFNNYGKLPVMQDFYGDGITRFQDQMPTILNIADNSNPIPLYADLQEYLDILQKYLPEAAFGRMEVDEALSSVQDEIEGLDFSDLRASE